MIANPSGRPGEQYPAASVAAPEVALEILGALQDIRFGSIEVTVHDGRVVQIERKEKFRPAGAGRDKA